MSDRISPRLRSMLDQELATAIEALLDKAAEHDGKDVIEANTDLMNDLVLSPLNRVQLASAVAALAMRLHRGDPHA